MTAPAWRAEPLSQAESAAHSERRERTRDASREDAEVIVVGAGPTGLSLACELFRHGVPCRVIDKALARSASSRATDIHARTLELFADTGLTERLLAVGRKVLAFNAFSGKKLVSRLDFSELDSPYRFSVAVPQRDTEELLEDALVAAGGAIERGTELYSVAAHGGGVTVGLSRGGRIERARCRFVVGCDGVRSAVRRAMGQPYEGITYPERYLVADVDLDWELPHDEVHLFMSREGFFNVVALPGGPKRGRVLCDLPAGDPRPPSLMLLDELCARRAGIGGRLGNPTFLADFRVHRRIVPSYASGPLLLAGDAAHTCSPLLGQGMNVGIQDAFNLGWKLARVCSGRAPISLLDSYEIERRPVAQRVLLQTDTMHRISRFASPLVCALRDASTAALSRFAPTRSYAALVCSEIGVGYAGSDVARADGARGVARRLIERITGAALPGAPLPGHRPPDVEIDPDGTRLSDLFSGDVHTLLLFAGIASRAGETSRLLQLAEDVHARFGDAIQAVIVTAGRAPAASRALIVQDQSGSLHARYGADRGCVFAVRPDRYIGLATSGRDALLDYLARVEGDPVRAPAGA